MPDQPSPPLAAPELERETEIPPGCICLWSWSPGWSMWQRTEAHERCHWHWARAMRGVLGDHQEAPGG